MRASVALLVLLHAPTATVALVTPRSTPPSPRVPSDAFVRDAEIKHGRVALVSGAVLAALSGAGFEHPTAVLSTCPVDIQLLFFSAVGIAEAATYLPRLDSMFSLREGVVPGRFTLGTSSAGENDPAIGVELTATRTAMVAVFAYMLYDVLSQ